MRTDALIQMLVEDVVPVRPLAGPWRRAVVWLTISLASVLLVVVFMSPNPARIANIRALRFWLEQAAALTTGIAAAAAALTSVVPGHSRRAWLLPVGPVAVWVGTLAWGCVRDWAQRGSAGLVIHSDWPCVAAMMLSAMLPATAIAIMLRRGAPLTPRATAAFAGLAVAGFSSVTACLSRPSPHGTTATVLVWHFGTALALVSVAAWAGRYLREWYLAPSIARRIQ
jgi:hypothetical protein